MSTISKVSLIFEGSGNNYGIAEYCDIRKPKIKAILKSGSLIELALSKIDIYFICVATYYNIVDG